MSPPQSNRITVEARPFLCRKCETRFEAETLQHVIIDVWVAQIKSISCPNCGATWRSLSFVSVPDEAVKKGDLQRKNRKEK
jgi:hypothetical protein